MKVLIACEESQTVCIEFRKKGHEAYSCDLQLCSGFHPEWHIISDVSLILNGNCSFYTCDGSFHFIESSWDLIIAHPPCTYLSKAGARHMYPSAGCIDENRLLKALAAKDFFMSIYNCNCSKIAIENPTPLKIVSLPEPSQVIQPYYFGHPYSKRTLLWLKGLPLLTPTQIIDNYSPFCPSNTSGFSKGKGGSFGIAYSSKERSKTFLGIACAMASQWG